MALAKKLKPIILIETNNIGIICAMVWLNPLFVWGPWPAFGVALHMSFPLVAYRILWGPQNIRVLHHRSCAFTAIGATWGQIETKRNLEMKFVMNLGLACSGCPPKPSTGSWHRWSSPLFCSGMKWQWKNIGLPVNNNAINTMFWIGTNMKYDTLR